MVCEVSPSETHRVDGGDPVAGGLHESTGAACTEHPSAAVSTSALVAMGRAGDGAQGSGESAGRDTARSNGLGLAISNPSFEL